MSTNKKQLRKDYLYIVSQYKKAQEDIKYWLKCMKDYQQLLQNIPSDSSDSSDSSYVDSESETEIEVMSNPPCSPTNYLLELKKNKQIIDLCSDSE